MLAALGAEVSSQGLVQTGPSSPSLSGGFRTVEGWQRPEPVARALQRPSYRVLTSGGPSPAFCMGAPSPSSLGGPMVQGPSLAGGGLDRRRVRM